MAKVLTGLFLSASVLAAVPGPADAAPMSKCRNNPENFSRFHGKCMSDKRIEKIQDRRGEGGGEGGGEDRHGPNHQ